MICCCLPRFCCGRRSLSHLRPFALVQPVLEVVLAALALETISRLALVIECGPSSGKVETKQLVHVSPRKPISTSHCSSKDWAHLVVALPDFVKGFIENDSLRLGASVIFANEGEQIVRLQLCALAPPPHSHHLRVKVEALGCEQRLKELVQRVIRIANN